MPVFNVRSRKIHYAHPLILKPAPARSLQIKNLTFNDVIEAYINRLCELFCEVKETSMLYDKEDRKLAVIEMHNTFLPLQFYVILFREFELVFSFQNPFQLIICNIFD